MSSSLREEPSSKRYHYALILRCRTLLEGISSGGGVTPYSSSSSACRDERLDAKTWEELEELDQALKFLGLPGSGFRAVPKDYALRCFTEVGS